MLLRQFLGGGAKKYERHHLQVAWLHAISFKVFSRGKQQNWDFRWRKRTLERVVQVVTSTYIYVYIYIYTECPRRNVRDFGRVFLIQNHTDITQNTYIRRKNGYGDNGQRKVWASLVSKYCMPSMTSYLSNAPARSKRHGNAVTLSCALQHGSSDVTR